jgi:glycosyltransferase involved in cell wall biosynthesis
MTSSEAPLEGSVASVVIPVRDMEDTLEGQLGALARQDYTGTWEVLIADNGSRDGSVAVAERWKDRLPLRLVDASGPADSYYARNVGASSAIGDLLLFCDADDEVRPEWLGAMVAALQQAPVVAGICDHARLNRREIAAVYDADIATTRLLPAGPTCNLGVRREIFDQLGGFREGYRYGEDTIFCWRVQLAGHRLIREPGAIIDRRRKQTARGIFRVASRRGFREVRDYTTFGERCVAPSPLRDVMYDYARTVAWLLSGRRYVAARMGGWRLGRLLGSMRHRRLVL